MTKRLRTFIVLSVLVSFIGSSVQMPAFAQIDPMPWMPKPGVMVPLSPQYTPAYLKGIVIHPKDPFKFDFIIYKGDKPLTYAQKKEEYTKLTKYFLASLAIPDDDQWVNLSPYEKDRIIKDDFGKTEMGRDLLAQDYLLKQITASLIYPESQLGKTFWAKVYAQAQKQYGTTNIPVNTFNKVWILPDDALIYEKGNTAYVLKNHLRVMLEEDYLSLQKHSGIENVSANKTHSIASKIVREIVLPELQKEVNEDANFAPLRQVYSGMLLATWFKRTLKQSLLGQIYANKGKVRGVDQDPRTNEKIYQRYLQAYKKGVFNFIKEDADRLNNAIMPRKYFSGGMVDDYAQIIQVTDRATLAQKETITGEENYDDAMSIVLKEDKTDEAMSAKQGTTTRVTFVQGTDTNRNNYLSYVIALPWFKATTGIDTTQGRRSIIDVGSSFGLTIPGLWGALKRVNPDFELTVTELPRTVPKAYIRSGRFWSSKGFAVIARDFAYKLYPNQIRDIMLVVDENYSIPEAVMLDSDGFTRIATSAETVSYMHGEPEKNLKTPLLGNMLGMLNDKNLADPKHLKQLIEASRSNAVDPDLSIEPDPLQAKFSKLGIGFQATEFPDLAKATSPAIIFYSHVLDHYPDDLRRRYWNTLQENLREKDVVITNDHVGSGTVKIVIYQKRRKKLINLGTINFNPRMLRAQSKEIDVTNYDRRRLAARFYMALVYKFKYRWPQLLRLVKNRSYIKAQMARIGRTDRQALEEAIKAAEAFTGSQIIFTEEQKEKLLSGDAAMGAGTDAAMKQENRPEDFDVRELEVLAKYGYQNISPPFNENDVDVMFDEISEKARKNKDTVAMKIVKKWIKKWHDGKVGTVYGNLVQDEVTGRVGIITGLANLGKSTISYFLSQNNFKILADDEFNLFLRSDGGLNALGQLSDELQKPSVVQKGPGREFPIFGKKSYSEPSFIVFLRVKNDPETARDWIDSTLTIMPFFKPETHTKYLEALDKLPLKTFNNTVTTESELKEEAFEIAHWVRTDLASPINSAMIAMGAGKEGRMIGKEISSRNKAMVPGGIDLNSANLAMTIKRDGNGVPLPLAQQDLAQFSNIQGLDPVILSIKPASQTALFSQLIGSH